MSMGKQEGSRKSVSVALVDQVWFVMPSSAESYLSVGGNTARRLVRDGERRDILV